MKLKETIAAIFGDILDRLRVYDSNDSIMIDGLDKNDEYCLRINSFFKTLYCVDLSKAGNIPVVLSEENISNLFNDHRSDPKGYLIWALVKKENHQKNYVFTFSKSIADRFENVMGGRKLHAFEIINSLYDLFLNNDYIVKNKNLVPAMDLSEEIRFENLSGTFNTIIKEAVYGNFNETDLFQSYQFSNSSKDIDLHGLFKLNFTGTIFTYINFSKFAVLPALNARIWQSTFVGQQKSFKSVREHYENGEVRLAVINSLIVLKQGYDSGVPSEIGNCMKTTYVRKNLHKKDILRSTPLLERDVKFDRIVDIKYFKNYFSMVHKENSDVADFHGVDLMGGFVNYGLKHPTKHLTNTRPHSLILGPSGSGKTTTVGKIMASMLEVDYKSWYAHKSHAKYFRLFDIKRSMRPLSDKLATNSKNDVKFLSANLNYFSYNLINIGEITTNGRTQIDVTELAFATDLLSVIIETLNKGKEGGLSAEEDGLFKDLVRTLYDSKKFTGVAIENLKESDPAAYNKMMALGYKDYQPTTETVEPEFEHLRKPILADLLNQLRLYQQTRDISAVKKKTAELLEGRLESVANLGYFSSYDKIDLKTGAYLYFDMDAIKDIPEYVPIFLAIFNRVYAADKKRQDVLKIAGKPRPEINYIFEEAKNLFVVKAFETILAKLANEARSYDIVLIFVLQRIADVPDYIFSQIESKIILFPADEEKEKIISELARLAKPSPEIIKLFEKTPQFGMTIWYEHGAFIMKFNLDEVEQKVFNSEGEKISVLEARG